MLSLRVAVHVYLPEEIARKPLVLKESEEVTMEDMEKVCKKEGCEEICQVRFHRQRCSHATLFG